MKRLKQFFAFVLSLAILVSAIPVSAIAVSAATAETYPEIKLGEVKTAVIAEWGQLVYFSFTPEEDGLYIFYAISNSDTYGYIFDTNMNILTSNDDGDDWNFKIEYQLKAGTTYILGARYYDENTTGNFDVSVGKSGPAASVEIEQGDAMTCYVGGLYSLSTAFYPRNAIIEEVVWSTSNPSVASVEDGMVEILSLGTANITVTSESGLTDTCVITVTDYPAVAVNQPVEISFQCSQITYVSFTPTTSGNYRIYYADASSEEDFIDLILADENLEWLAYSDEGIIDYYFTGGETYLIQTSYMSSADAINETCTIAVAELLDAESITIEEGEAISGYIWDSLTLHAAFTPEFSMTEDYTWSSDNTAVATVDRYGNVELISAGTAVITVASENGLYDTCTVTVEDFPTIYENEQTTVDITEGGISRYFSFTPEEDGYYSFYSMSDLDTYGYILDADGNVLKSDDDSGVDSNFKIKYQMEAGNTYVLRARYYDSGRAGTFNVCVEEIQVITSLEVTSLPNKIDYIKGFAYNNVSYEGLKLKVTWSDGSTTEWSIDKDGYSIGGDSVSINKASVDEDGTIYITCNNQEVSFTVNLLEDPVESIEVVTGTANTYIENIGGYWDEWYNEETEAYEEFFYYYVDSYDIDDAVVKINYKDGTSKTANVGDEVDGYWINWSENQSNQPWGVGSNNQATISYLGATADLPITVIENPVESIELVSGTSYKYVENYNGQWDERYNNETGEYEDYFRYYAELYHVEDAVVKINYKDGTSQTASIGDEVEDGYWIEWYDEQYNQPWVVGTNNQSTISYLGATVNLLITVMENPVESIEVITGITTPYIENFGGYWDERYDEETGEYEKYFYYATHNLNDVVVQINYKDGTSKTANVNEYLDGYWVNWDSDQDYQPWVVGSNNQMTISYLGATVNLSVPVIENPVESIELVYGTSKTYIENCDGIWDEWYNEETEQYEEFFRYYVDSYRVNDAVVKINYKDGTSKTASVGDYIDGYAIDWNDNQYNQPWVVGSNNQLTISYLGFTVNLPITVIESPVESIEVVSGAARQYIENYGGYWEQRYNEETGEYEDYYYYNRHNLTDVVVQINYKDGTSQTASIGDEVEDGYWIEWYPDQYNQPWVVGGNNKMTISYLGVTADLPITVIENPVESIELVSGTSYKYLENYNGQWDEWYNDETEEYEEFFRYYISSYDVDDAVIKINYKDGTSQTANVGDEVDDGYWIEWNDEQYNQPWVVGSNNQTTISYLGVTVNLPITVEPNPVESIELVSGTSYKYIENYDGQWDDRYNGETGGYEEFFRYYIDSYRVNDAVVKINYKDGTSKTANVGDEVDGYWVELDESQYDQPWVVGANNQSTISYLGATVNLPITVEESPIESIELVSGTSYKYIENYDGQWDERYNGETGEYEEFFRYYTNSYDVEDAIVKINYKDGTSKTANVGDYIDGYTINWDDNQYDHPWVLGSNNQSTITYLGATVNLPITVIENPVESIELVSGTSKTYMENIDGYWDEWYNEATGDYEKYFRYYTDSYDVEDAIVKINYKDGTSKTANVGDDIDGYEIDWSSNQYNQPWVVGTNNQSVISYLGFTVNLPITVTENQVDRIVINQAPTREYVYGDITVYDGDMYGELDSDGEYWFYPSDLTGLSFTVYYKDGTSKTYTHNDIDGYYIDGHEFDLSYDGYNPEPGNFPVTFTYLGKTVEYTVVLKESPVASMEIVKGPTKTNYTEDPYYYPIFDGMELKITYTDGTSKVVTLTEENTTYDQDEYFGFHAKMYIDGYLLQIEEYWLDEGTCYFAEYLGQSCKIEDITYIDGTEVASVALDNVSWNGEGMVANVKYEDGTTETITLNDVILCYGRENDYFEGLKKTEDGYLYFSIETYLDANGEIDYYCVHILGQDIEVEPSEPDILYGDVNSDGVIDARDITFLRRYYVGWDVTIDEAAADVNVDNVIDARDITILRRYYVGWDIQLG